MNVLYLEDSPTDSELTRQNLKSAAPEIHLEIVASIKSAQVRLLEYEAAVRSGDDPLFDLLLLDLDLPDGNGLELLAFARQRALPLPVVVLTGSGDESRVISALRGGADDYLPKRLEYWSDLPRTLRSAAASFKSRAARAERPLRLLYAESNTLDASVTQRHLRENAPYIAMEVVQSAQQLIARMPDSGLRLEHDVLLLDYMPAMDALEALKEIRLRRLDIPVIVTTASGTEEIALQALKLGASDYIVKSPGYLHRLPFAIDAAFHRASLKQANRHLHTLSARLMEVQESERAQIARELHDRIGGNLAALSLNIGLIRSRLPEEASAPVQKRLQVVQQLIQDTTAQVRDVMAELRPPALDDYGLLAALRIHVQARMGHAGAPINVRGEEFRLPHDVELVLFRIAQEALNNAVRHAKASRIDVTLISEGTAVMLTVEDDGEGFDSKQSAGKASWGISIMRERADAVGAAVRVESRLGGGTRVLAQWIRKPA